MISLNELNPIAAFLWLMLTAGIAMFVMNPIILALSLAGAALYFFARRPDAGAKPLLFYIAVFLISAVMNPLFVHSGATVLFVVNHNPITLEALYYGMALGGMIASSLCWFRSFQEIMTSDKLLYVFGSALPKLTLILSIALRYIPLLKDQAKRVRDAQRALGLFREENVIDRLRGEIRIFSVLVTWVLENGIITADSMTARGYGTGRRTRFALFRFRGRDAALCALCVALGGAAIAAAASGALSCSFYPRFRMSAGGPLAAVGYACYALLAFAPGILELEERFRWKALRSKV